MHREDSGAEVGVIQLIGNGERLAEAVAQVRRLCPRECGRHQKWSKQHFTERAVVLEATRHFDGLGIEGVSTLEITLHQERPTERTQYLAALPAASSFDRR